MKRYFTKEVFIEERKI